MTKWKILALVLVMVGAATVWAQGPGKKRVALVVQVKGVVTHPDRLHKKPVQLKPFEAVHEGEKIEVRSDSEITLAFLQNNKRYTIKNPGTQAVYAEVTPQGFKDNAGVDSSPPGRQAAKLPVGALDFSKMGGFSSRSLLRLGTRNEQVVIHLSLLPTHLDLSSTAPTPIYWKETGLHSDWQQATGKLIHQSDARTVIVLDLAPKAGKSYQVNIGARPATESGYHLDLFRLTDEQNATLTAYEKELKDQPTLLDYRSYISLLVNSGLTEDALNWLNQAQKSFPEGDDWNTLRGKLLSTES